MMWTFKNTKELFLERGTFDIVLYLTHPSLDYKSTLTPRPASRWGGGGGYNLKTSNKTPALVLTHFEGRLRKRQNIKW